MADLTPKTLRKQDIAALKELIGRLEQDAKRLDFLEGERAREVASEKPNGRFTYRALFRDNRLITRERIDLNMAAAEEGQSIRWPHIDDSPGEPDPDAWKGGT